MDKLMKVFGSLLPKLALKMIRNKKDDILTKMNENEFATFRRSR